MRERSCFCTAESKLSPRHFGSSDWSCVICWRVFLKTIHTWYCANPSRLRRPLKTCFLGPKAPWDTAIGNYCTGQDNSVDGLQSIRERRYGDKPGRGKYQVPRREEIGLFSAQINVPWHAAKPRPMASPAGCPLSGTAAELLPFDVLG